MMLTPLPGNQPDSLVRTLSEIVDDANRQNAPGLTAAELRAVFLSWFRLSRQRATNILTPSDADSVLPMPNAWRIASASASNMMGDPAYGLIDSEFSILIGGLRAARDALVAALTNLGQTAGRFAVLDTSVYIQHRAKLDDLVIALDLEERSAPVRIVFPMVVVDELDRLKEHPRDTVRWRAAHTLGKLDALLDDGIGPRKLRDGNGPTEPPPHGATYVEVMHDSPGHIRLPIEDDEIIDRALALDRLTQSPNRRVTLVTFDTGQSMRARAAGLHVVKLDRREHQAGSKQDVDPVQ